MTVVEQACYTLINIPHDSEPISEMQLRQDLEKGETKVKIEALKKAICFMLNGEKMPSLLMTVIRFVMPSQDHTIKKLLLLFWEIVPKNSADGKLLQEMILVCDAYRRDLQHPNEYIRGSTLRFLCKLKEPDLLEPLMPAIRACLEHRIAYVRRNAVMAIFIIYKNFEHLIPDAPQLIAEYLEGEQDMSCKRNAFMMLIQVDQEKALNYLSSVIEQVNSFGDILQLVIVELIYKVCHANPAERARFIRCIYNLLNSTSASVRYEAAGTLVTLSSAPTAIRAAAGTYIDLVIKESDNNVKLIVLDRLAALKDVPQHQKVLQELVMDILRVLSASDLEVKRKTLKIVLDLVSSKNIREMILVLKKEVSKSTSPTGHEDTEKYRQLLVQTLHQCSVRFPDVASDIIPILVEFLSDSNEPAAADVLVFVREAIHRFEGLRPLILAKLLEVFPTIRSEKILRSTLWILGEYCIDPDNIQTVMTLVRQSLGDLPIVDDEMKRASGEMEQEDIEMQNTVQRLVTADGTYATQSAFVASGGKKKGNSEPERPPMRALLIEGDFFIASALGTALLKQVFRYVALVPDPLRQNRFVAEAMYILSSILRLGRSGLTKKAINEDDLDRIALCIRLLSEAPKNEMLHQIINIESRNAVSSMLSVNKMYEEKAKEKDKGFTVHVDDPISFGQLVGSSDFGEKEDQFDLTLKQAIGLLVKKGDDAATSTKLHKVVQLSGFSDPVYVEAYVNVNQFDIVLDVLIVNQTDDTLQNLNLELATIGDLRIVEKPSLLTLAAHDFAQVKAILKVGSTDNGIVFGNVVYELASGRAITGDAGGDRNVVILSDISVDIMDYIVPASCTDSDFRKMWAEFEWENKVSVNTNIADLRDYLQHLIKTTNMRCLTAEQALQGECGFLAANLYAKSLFGEDALANLSIEKVPGTDGPVQGHIRIRAKSQGMALSLGEKINAAQKIRS